MVQTRAKLQSYINVASQKSSLVVSKYVTLYVNHGTMGLSIKTVKNKGICYLDDKVKRCAIMGVVGTIVEKNQHYLQGNLSNMIHF